MQTFIFTLGIFLLFVVLMAIGVILKRKPIEGSCGGINKLDGISKVCDCERPCSEAVEAEKNAEKM